MDEKFAKTVYTLLVAAKLKKTNPAVSDLFVQKNKEHFPNASDRQVSIKKEKENVSSMSDEDLQKVVGKLKTTFVNAVDKKSMDPRTREPPPVKFNYMS